MFSLDMKYLEPKLKDLKIVDNRTVKVLEAGVINLKMKTRLTKGIYNWRVVLSLKTNQNISVGVCSDKHSIDS